MLEDEFIRKISIDWETISFGALDWWTKHGLDKALRSLGNECEILDKKEKNEMIV